jgi:hypothetical protein
VEGAGLALRLAGTAGASASAEGARRQERRQKQLRSRFGRFAGVANLLSDDPQTTTSWVIGGASEGRVGAFLERELSGVAIVLHDRRVPGSRANIDHVAVAPSGIWVIDSKAYSGRIKREDVGPLWRSDYRLTVDGKDRTKVVLAMAKQAQVVAAAVAGAGEPPPTRPVLRFNGADWGLVGKPFELDGVLITYPGKLVEQIRSGGSQEMAEVGRLAARIAVSLPSAS